MLWITLTKQHAEQVTLGLNNAFVNYHFQWITLSLNWTLNEQETSMNLIKKTLN